MQSYICTVSVKCVSLRVAQLNAFFCFVSKKTIKNPIKFRNFLENDFWTPLPPTIRLLSILYITLICNT